MSVQTNNVKKLFYTKMQRDIILTDPKELYCVAGRGTGKSTRIIAKLSANRVLDMPGASFLFYWVQLILNYNKEQLLLLLLVGQT